MAKERKQPLPPPEFNERDTQIFKHIYECDGLTSRQISALHYPLEATPEERVFPLDIPHSNCLRRLLQLFEYGYLERTEQPETRSRGTKENVHRLSKTGVAQLARGLDIPPSELPFHSWRAPSGEFLEHFILRN